MMRVRHLGLVGVAVVVIAGAWTAGWWSFFPLDGLQEIARSSEERLQGGTPALQLSASEVDFGEVPLGSVREASLVLTNVGTAPLRIAEIRTGGRFSLVRAPLLPARIGPGVSVRVNVAFTPAGPGMASDQLQIMSDAPSGMLSVPLRAVAVGNLVAKAKRAAKPLARVAKRALEGQVLPAEVRLPLPTADPGALPVVRSLIELTSFLRAEDVGALQLISDEASLEVGVGPKTDLKP